MKLKKLFACLLLGAALMTVPLAAQEASGRPGSEKPGSEKTSSEKPGSEKTEKPSMEIWKWANFAILAGILGYLISKNMGPVLTARSAEILEGLEAGKRAKADADARAVAVQAKLAGLDQAVAQMKASAKEDQEREVARVQRDTAAELQRIQQHALVEIESAGKLARLEIRRAAALAAIELAEQKVRARMNPDAQAALLQNFGGEIAAAPHES